jgi:anhydro-N-acetylmuramic acid kinase
MTEKPHSYTILGLMSGSSLDGLDLALCQFERSPTQGWTGKILASTSRPFPEPLEDQLRQAPLASGLELLRTETAFLRFTAEAVGQFCRENDARPLLVASHGHTVFHHPADGYTLQIGNGGILSGLLQLPVVSDFRTLDVGLGGQGAPLVPGAEKVLFAHVPACLNLGGICNLSFRSPTGFLGFDVGPCNQLLNQVAAWTGKPYDENGQLAAQGQPIPNLLQQLNGLSYYTLPAPKSLGNEEVAQIWKPLLEPWKNQPEHVSQTLCQHIGYQIGKSLAGAPGMGPVLVTGGGAFHQELVRAIEKHLPNGFRLDIPSPEMIAFKEAYCFAFLGLLRWLGETNVWADVTGARVDSVSGAVYGSGFEK